MILSPKTLEKLRLLINEETEYRSGPRLVQFFNQLGFRDSYGKGFPSRWVYTDQKLAEINGSPELDKCIKMVLSPANFIGRAAELDAHICDFNQFLAFDKWKLVRLKAELSFEKLDEIEFDEGPLPSQNGKQWMSGRPLLFRSPVAREGVAGARALSSISPECAGAGTSCAQMMVTTGASDSFATLRGIESTNRTTSVSSSTSIGCF